MNATLGSPRLNIAHWYARSFEPAALVLPQGWIPGNAVESAGDLAHDIDYEVVVVVAGTVSAEPRSSSPASSHQRGLFDYFQDELVW